MCKRQAYRVGQQAPYNPKLHSAGKAATERLYRAIQQNCAPLSAMPCIACRAMNEWLGTHIFHSIQEVQDRVTQWLWTYNNDRPNLGIGGITPAMKLNQYQMAA
jgi:transposase InsO family protein